MFKSQNFCHIASNNRNQVKVGVFVYRTTDDLTTVLTSGYFNDRIIDINLHDLIIHEKVDNADATKAQRNLLCVTERTLENVGTTLIKSKWEGDIETEIATIEQAIENLPNVYVKKDGTSVMSAPLKFLAGSMRGAVGPYLNGVSFWKMDSQGNITNIANITDSQFYPVTTNSIDLGNTTHTWKDAYVARVITSVLNNGYDIAVPVTNSADTLALKSEVDLAANSGRMITDQGVWYAKMYTATVAPSAENGTNYADFSQTDGQGNPIIVIYERQSGAWVQSETITPPAEYDGYVPITSKIWDIPEQTGQQGGRVLWNHQSKEFTPYPQIISFDNIEVTGDSTVIMPNNPSGQQIVNKDYVDAATSGSGYHPDILDWKWADHQLNDVQWLRADTFSWQSGAVYQAAYQHLEDDIDGQTAQTEIVAGITISFYLANDGHKIVLADQESNVAAIYAATGVAWYYILDTVNQRFKLPRRHSTQVIQSGVDADGKWFRIYADGWVEQGGYTNASSQPSGYITLPVPMANTSYWATSQWRGGSATDTGSARSNYNFCEPYSTTQILVGTYDTTNPCIWQVCGWSGLDLSLRQCGEKHLYFYVGSFTQTALENTAGLNAELFNGKADLNLANVLANIDFVVERQEPTAANNYTWYRKYRSGWVEQGGQLGITTSAGGTVTLPIQMSNTYYNVFVQTAFSGTEAVIYSNRTTTSFDYSGNVGKDSWYVCGMAA